GHFEGDAQAYRGEELNEAAERDPLPAYEKRLISAGLLSEESAAEIRAEVEAEVQAAIEFAKASPEPKPADAYLHVFA
ncbi:MAG: thiamine pyrophosphate-dependent enzyme, partial [Candidatus Nanopelagicales bacterium]